MTRDQIIIKIFTLIAFFRLNGVDISTGNDLEYLLANTLEKCEQACEYNERCKGYVYNPNTDKCWLKDNLNQLRNIDFNINSGIKVH